MGYPYVNLEKGDFELTVAWVQAPLVELASEVEVVLRNPLVPVGNTSLVAGQAANSSNVTLLGPLGALALAVEIVR